MKPKILKNFLKSFCKKKFTNINIIKKLQTRPLSMPQNIDNMLIKEIKIKTIKLLFNKFVIRNSIVKNIIGISL